MFAPGPVVRFCLPVLLLCGGLRPAMAQPAGSALDYEGELSIPAVARYLELPQRLFLRSEFDLAEAGRFFPEEYLPRFLQIMQDDYDDELKYQVARSLERIVREKMAPADTILPVARKSLQQSEDLNVRRACAMVLLAADSEQDAELLADLCRAGDLHANTLIEPRLSEWNSQVLVDDWMQRIQQPTLSTRNLVRLACDGLAAVGQQPAVSELGALAQRDSTQFQVRQAAARAVAQLAPEQAGRIATSLAEGTFKDRLTAVALLQTATSDSSLTVLSALCDDSSGTVAALAWQTLFEQDPARLTDRLTQAKSHTEANVRHAVIQTGEALPNERRIDLLNQMMADRDLYVRNHAREALIRLTDSAPQLKDRILANAGDVTAQADAPWEQLEQALVLLSVLRHDAYQPNCIELMKHSRPEVYVTAAWMLHLMPRKELSAPAVAQAKATWQKLQNQDVEHRVMEALSLQLGCLFHVAGFTKDEGLRSVCELQFNKEVPTSVPSRSAAMWALGMLSEASEDADLQQRFVDRIFDDDPMNPEAFEVRAGAALSLGLLGSRTAIEPLRRALNNYGYGSELSKAAATSLVTLGEERPEFPDVPPEPISGWPIRIPK